ncbi:hypothetical protein NESM_000312700 [Novymonas esmeraldas]|uniref:Uncharacterized protein n=1 Tax=Novymonas esmeraldas TaxID=1808958 RepID=A0AAW0EK80_9TRYP
MLGLVQQRGDQSRQRDRRQGEQEKDEEQNEDVALRHVRGAEHDGGDNAHEAVLAGLHDELTHVQRPLLQPHDQHRLADPQLLLQHDALRLLRHAVEEHKKKYERENVGGGRQGWDTTVRHCGDGPSVEVLRDVEGVEAVDIELGHELLQRVEAGEHVQLRRVVGHTAAVACVVAVLESWDSRVAHVQHEVEALRVHLTQFHDGPESLVLCLRNGCAYRLDTAVDVAVRDVVEQEGGGVHVGHELRRDGRRPHEVEHAARVGGAVARVPHHPCPRRVRQVTRHRTGGQHHPLLLNDTIQRGDLHHRHQEGPKRVVHHLQPRPIGAAAQWATDVREVRHVCIAGDPDGG